MNTADILASVGVIGLMRAIYEHLCAVALNYHDDSPFSPDGEIEQLIRPPATMLEEHRGTCIDLSLLVCGLCLIENLVPLFVALEGHALVGVGKRLRRGDTRTLEFRQGMLTDAQKLQALETDYFFLECTGFAVSRRLGSSGAMPELAGRNENGTMDFKQALETGREQIRGCIAEPSQSNSVRGRRLWFVLDVVGLLDDLRLQRDIGLTHLQQVPQSVLTQDGAIWPVASIIDLISAAYTHNDFTMLCGKHFPEIYSDFGNTTKTEKIKQLVKHCLNSPHIEQLLDIVQQERPAQFARFKSRLSG